VGGALSALTIILIALGLILGFFTRAQAMKKIGHVLLLASLLPILLAVVKDGFLQLPLSQKIIFGMILLTAGTLGVLRVLLGRGLFHEILARFTYDAVRAVVLSPFRLISRIFGKYR